MMWENGHAQKGRQMKTCTYDMKSCYEAQTMPVIFNMTQNSSYLTGGSNVTVYGFGFDSGDVVAKIDGVDCKVTSTDRESFSCTVQPKAKKSVINVPLMGHNGLRVNTLRAPKGLPWNYTQILGNQTPNYTIGTEFEELMLHDNHFYRHHEGWFIPPKTTGYRFYTVCTDLCRVSLGETPNNVTNPKVIVAQTKIIPHMRNFFEDLEFGKNSRSEWVNLTKGEPYYIVGQHHSKQDYEHFSVAVEIDDQVDDHHHQMKEVHFLSV
jgi:hypothetical protein